MMKKQYQWREQKVTANARKAFELATDIAGAFDDEKTRTAYFLFAALNIRQSAIYKVLEDQNCYIVPRLTDILQDKEVYAAIFGEAAAEKFFSNQEEEAGCTEEIKKIDDVTKLQDVGEQIICAITDAMESMMPNPQWLETAYSDKFENACEEAWLRCKAMNLDYITMDAIVYSILQNKDTSAYRFMNMVIEDFGITMDEFLNGFKMVANIADVSGEGEVILSIPKSLESCIEILNAKYSKGQEITILGRDKEMQKVFSIFSKKTKRNAVLVGLPGVGKTAIIEAITQSIVNGTCPKEFIGYTVLSLDVNAMIAGTKYRGEFETKVAILKTFLEGTRKIILFVDEMHQMLGAGGVEGGGVDLSGSLKPILSRDDVVFVGATTEKEYNTILSRDGAFKRRFEVVIIKEPKSDELKPMISGKLKKLQEHHGVELSEELLDYIILCSSCFNMESANPDKTLDLCDRSMAIAKMEGSSLVKKEHITKVYNEYFESYEKIDEEEREATSYHEAGHFVATRLSKEYETKKIVALTIIPTDKFLGANILERTGKFVSSDMSYVNACLVSLLAGRVAQYKKTGRIDSGASDDLKRAKALARSVIVDFGMDQDEYAHICILEDDCIDEKTAEKINKKVNILIQEAYVKTKEFVDEHWSLIESVAKYLLEKKIVTSEELEQFFK